ncbi:M24 family metallopeptidase [Thermosulfuriphilus sp.]
MKALEKIRQWLRRHGLGAILIRGPENRRYLSGFTPQDSSITESSGSLLITKKKAYILTDGRFVEEAQETKPAFVPIILKKDLSQELLRILKEEKIEKMAYEEAYVSCAFKKALERKLHGIELFGCQGVVERLRETKTDPEIEKIRQALKIAEAILKEIIRELRPGMTEKEVAWKIIEASWRLAEGPSFPPIVAFGENAARPHAEPGLQRLNPEDPVIIDMGVRWQGYCSDITRSLCLKPDERYQRIYQIVRQAQKEAIKSLRAGVPAREVDKAARRIIKKEGFGEYFVHSLGHGVGLAVHEAPALSARSRQKLKDGAVVTVEPGIYIPGWGGVRLENMVVVKKEGAKVLNQLP